MLEINPIAVLMQALAFVALAVALKKFAFGPIGDQIEARRREIQGTLDQIAADRRAMEATRSEYEQRLANIEAEARERITAAVKLAQEEAGILLSRARDESNEIRAKAVADIELEKKKALVEIRSQMTDLAVLAAGKVLERELNPNVHRDLVRDFIHEMTRTS